MIVVILIGNILKHLLFNDEHLLENEMNTRRSVETEIS
jgi:hypothetical protein